MHLQLAFEIVKNNASTLKLLIKNNHNVDLLHSWTEGNDRFCNIPTDFILYSTVIVIHYLNK